MVQMIIHVGNILEYETKTEIECCYGLSPFPMILRSTSIDIVVPEALDSTELSNVLLSSGLPIESTQVIIDCYRHRKQSLESHTTVPHIFSRTHSILTSDEPITPDLPKGLWHNMKNLFKKLRLRQTKSKC